MERKRRVGSADRDLVADLYPSLRRFASVVCPAEDNPNDLVQEALLRALRKGPLGDLDNPGAYLRRTIFNLASNRRRWLARQRKALTLMGPPPVERPVYSWDVEELLTVPPKARAILYLRIIEGRPFEEIAGLLGCSQVSARATASRARRRLRSILEEEVRDGTA